MNWSVFWSVLLVGWGFVLLQGYAASCDGYLTQAQMYSHGVTNGWSIMQHGGCWADILIISPIVAYAVSKYRLDYFSFPSRLILAIAIMVTMVAMLFVYRKNGMTTPEAHTHDDKTTLAGWIHGVFAVAALWVCALVYLDITIPSVSKMDIVIFSLLLTPFFDLGVRKFSRRWKYDTATKWQVGIEIVGLWIITILRTTVWHA